MPVTATRLLRKMRGGAQAHLLAASDGRHYVTKFRENPQHRRILVNEWVAGVILQYLQIPSPAIQIVELRPEFLLANPEVNLQLGSRTVPVAPGWHFGSAYPGDPDRLAVYDFLPDSLLPDVVNLRDFLGVLAFDKWVGNADSRQAIFFRARLRQWLSDPEVSPQRKGFVAVMIDHGYAFNGPHWEFVDSPLTGLFHRPIVYQSVRSWRDFEPWLERIRYFPDAELDRALRSVPPRWLNGDRDELERLLLQLQARRARTPELIRDCTRGRVNPFPNWDE